MKYYELFWQDDCQFGSVYSPTYLDGRPFEVAGVPIDTACDELVAEFEREVEVLGDIIPCIGLQLIVSSRFIDSVKGFVLDNPGCSVVPVRLKGKYRLRASRPPYVCIHFRSIQRILDEERTVYSEKFGIRFRPEIYAFNYSSMGPYHLFRSEHIPWICSEAFADKIASDGANKNVRLLALEDIEGLQR